MMIKSGLLLLLRNKANSNSGLFGIYRQFCRFQWQYMFRVSDKVGLTASNCYS